jgi:hypothetical protein
MRTGWLAPLRRPLQEDVELLELVVVVLVEFVALELLVEVVPDVEVATPLSRSRL